MLNNRIKFFLKLCLTIFLIYLVFKNIDLKQVLEITKYSDLKWLFIGFIFYNISKIISAIRLNYYFKDFGVYLKSKINIQLYYVGMFYNLFLPGGIGGDGYKAYILKKTYNVKIGKFIKALLFDRISGLVGLVFFFMLLLSFSSLNFSYLYNFIVFVVTLLLYPVYYYICKKFKLFFKYIFQTLFLGLLVQFIQILSALAIIYSLNTNINIVDFIEVFLLSSIVGALPLTIGGIGARELTFLYAFDYLGYSVDIGIAFSIVFFVITALSSLIGFLFIHRDFNTLLKNE